MPLTIRTSEREISLRPGSVPQFALVADLDAHGIRHSHAARLPDESSHSLATALRLLADWIDGLPEQKQRS